MLLYLTISSIKFLGVFFTRYFSLRYNFKKFYTRKVNIRDNIVILYITNIILLFYS